MKIAIPIMFFSRPGGARVLSKLASEWMVMGHQVAFLCTAHSDAPYYPTTADIIWLDDQGYRVGTNMSDGLCDIGGARFVSHNLYVQWKGINRYARDFDILLASMNTTAWPVLFGRTRARKFYYVQAYEPEYYESRSDKRARLLDYLARMTYLLPLRRIVNSPIYLEYKLLRADHWVPPGLDFSEFFPKTTAFAHEKGRPLILGCIGRREVEKGTVYVYEAFVELLRRGVDVELHVAFGNLPPEQAAHPKCRIIVPQNDRELGEYYRSVDIMIAPGLVQLGAPHYPVMEAMACGVPVITTGYLPATNDNAWIVPIKDSPAIAAAVVEILEHAERTNAKIASAKEAIAVFTWRHVAREMLNLFEAVTSGPTK